MKIEIKAELDVDESMFNNREEYTWFIKDVLLGNDLEVFSHYIGDYIGKLKIDARHI